MVTQLKEAFLHGDLIQLVPTNEEDLDFVKMAEQAPENAQFVGDWPREQHRAALSDPDILHFTVFNTSHKRAGYVILTGVSGSDHNINLRRLVVTQKGTGHGTEVLHLVKRLCFEVLDAHRLWLDVVDDNTKAQHIYKKAGFVCEGVMRECMRYPDKYKSLIIMSILSQEYDLVK